MSLEQNIADLTVAVKTLTEEFRGKPKLSGDTGSGAPWAGTPAEQVKQPAAADKKAAETAAPAVDYATVLQPLIHAAVKAAGKPAIISLINSYKAVDGVPAANGKMIQPKDYADLVTKLNAAIAASSNADSIV